jgi:chromosome segregation ATPase
VTEPTLVRISPLFKENGSQKIGSTMPLTVEFSDSEQLWLDLGETSSSSKAEVVKRSTASTQDTVWDELQALRSQVHEQVERIHHLEQALDQSVSSAADLRLQLVNQQFLEAQLASTEEIANIQQQAIIQLKQRLAQKQSALESYENQTNDQTQSFQELLVSLEDRAEGQQTNLKQLWLRIHSDRAETQAQQSYLETWLTKLQTPVSDQQDLEMSPQSLTLETESGETGSVLTSEQLQPSLLELGKHLTKRQAVIEQLEMELHRAHIALQEQQAMIDTLQQTHSTRSPASDSSLDKELFTAHCKIQELEIHLSKQTTTQAMLQHFCQELEQARDRHQTRIVELEHQTADMQEQILKQAQQASEYETAIQHWKDRYHNSHDYLNRLKELIGKVLPDSSVELSEILAIIQTATADAVEVESDRLPLVSPKSTNIDVPDFLLRRHRYRVRS